MKTLALALLVASGCTTVPTPRYYYPPNCCHPCGHVAPRRVAPQPTPPRGYIYRGAPHRATPVKP